VFGGIMLVDMIRSERVRLHELAVEKKDIASDDNQLKVTASGFWVKRTDLNKRASLQAAYKDKEFLRDRDQRSKIRGQEHDLGAASSNDARPHVEANDEFVDDCLKANHDRGASSVAR
jgi:hypothetical protein